MAYAFTLKINSQFMWFQEVQDWLKDKHHRSAFITKFYWEVITFPPSIFKQPIKKRAFATVPLYVFYDDNDAVEFMLRWGDHYDQTTTDEMAIIRNPTPEEMQILNRFR